MSVNIMCNNDNSAKIVNKCFEVYCLVFTIYSSVTQGSDCLSPITG